MKSINISTDTFAAIWAARQDGEDSEDEILSRLLGAKAKSQPAPAFKKAAPALGQIPKQKLVKPPIATPAKPKKAEKKQGGDFKFSTTDLDLLS